VLTEAIVSSNSAIASGDLSAYQGAEIDDKQRKSPRIRQIKSTDRLLPKDKRKNLQLNTQDLQRNFPIAAWAIRRHLDYVSCFNFQAKNKDAGLNRDIEALMSWYSRPANCDVAGRHSLRAQTRINEALRVVDGDMATVTYQTGHLQGIESDRIRDPDKIRKDDDRDWETGCRDSILTDAVAFVAWPSTGDQRAASMSLMVTFKRRISFTWVTSNDTTR